MKKLILLTGGSGRVGRVLIRDLLSRGYDVAASARSEASAALLIEEFRSFGSSFFGFQADLLDVKGPSRLVEKLADESLRPFALINNARSVEYLKTDEAGRVERADFISEFSLDVIAPYELTMELSDQPGSLLRKVINIGSMYGSVAANPSLYDDPLRQSPIQYGVCKAALSHLTKELAVRLSAKNIQVNCVAYGGIEGRVDPAFTARYAALNPMGRMLQESDIAGPIEALLSDGFSAMTGHTMAVDGGWSIW